MDRCQLNEFKQKCLREPFENHACPICGKTTPNERVLVANTILCRDCTPQPSPIFGVMEYSEKAGGTLIITDDEKEFHELKKPANQRR